MFGITAGDISVPHHHPLLAQEPKLDLPPEGFYKLLFSDGRDLFIMTEELMKYPFFNVLTKTDNGGFKESNNRTVDFRNNDVIKIDVFNLVRKLMEGKKKDLFEKADISLLEDPRFFDELQACFEFLYPKQAVLDVEHLRGEMLDRLHQKVLRSINVHYAIRLFNAFAVSASDLKLQQIDDLKIYPLELLREGFRIAHDFVIFRDVIECLIVTKTFFDADVLKADKFFQYFHDLRTQMVYLKSKEISLSREHLQAIAQTYRNQNSEQIRKLDIRLAELSLEIKDLKKGHKEFEDKKEEGDNTDIDKSLVEFNKINRLEKALKIEKEFCSARKLQILTDCQKAFHAESIAALATEISKLCFHVLLPKQALSVLETIEATPLERYIAQSALDEFRRCILHNTLKDNRLIFPFRGDMVDWSVKLLAYYNFQIVNDEIQHPFQLAAVENGTLADESYRYGFRYFFSNHTPADLQNEIRSDLKICGMTEGDIGPRMEGVPDVSDTFMDMERGVLVLLKKILKQVVRVEEIPSFENVKNFVNLLRYYWEHIYQRNPNYLFRVFLSFMELGKPWNLHAQTPIELERLMREKLSTEARFSYIDSSQSFLLKKVHVIETDNGPNRLRSVRFSDEIDLPDPLYDFGL